MSKADQIERKIMKAVAWGTGIWAAIAILSKWQRDGKGTSGIGDIPAWNKSHIRNWIAYEHTGYPERIVIDPTYQDHLGRKLVQSYPNSDRYSNRTFWVNRENEGYLVELCKDNGVRVEYIWRE